MVIGNHTKLYSDILLRGREKGKGEGEKEPSSSFIIAFTNPQFLIPSSLFNVAPQQLDGLFPSALILKLNIHLEF